MKKFMNNLRTWYQTHQDESEQGQSLIILAFAFLGLIAMLGLALDLGVVYVNRVELKRAIDAAALSAAPELPIEEQSIKRAMAFLIENGYPDANFYVAGCFRDVHDEYNVVAGDTSDRLINWPTNNDFQDAIGITSDGIGGGADYVITATMPITIPEYWYLYAAAEYDGSNKPIADPGQASFYIDTRSFQTRTFDEDGNPSGQVPGCGSDEEANPSVATDAGSFGSAPRIKISGDVPVDMNFMQFFGFGTVNVPDAGVAQNAANLDVVVVMDTTGSMEFDTICYGCWEKCNPPNPSSGEGINCPDGDEFLPYPTNGEAYPLPWTASFRETYICANGLNGGDCSDPDLPEPAEPLPAAGQNYIIMEAELYALNTSIWDPSFRGPGEGYWALQRRGYSESVDDRAAHVRHHPYLETTDTGGVFGRFYTLQDAIDGNAPRLEYDFVPTWSGLSYIWLRVQAFQHQGDRNVNPANHVYWQVVRTERFDTNPIPQYPEQADVTPVLENSSDTSGDAYNFGAANYGNNEDWQADDNDWDWIRLGPVNMAPNAVGGAEPERYRLKLWAGNGGYAIDRIIVTNSIYDEVSEITADIDDNPATPGTAQRYAADICNPIFGQSVLSTQCRWARITGQSAENLKDPLFSDEQPIRGSKQAIRAFVERLDPEFDQAGFVSFDNTAIQEAQLECVTAAIKRDNAGTQINDYPIDSSIFGAEFDETVCAGSDLSPGTDAPIGYQNVFIGIEDTNNGGSTDIADGLRRGLHMLGITTDDDGTQTNDCDWQKNGGNWEIGGQTQPSTNISSHCSRGAAATQVIVLLTDGAPTDGSPGDNDECRAWTGEPYDGFPSGDNKFECIMYYAEIAGDNGVIVYTIGLGAGADPDIMGAVAAETNGNYYYAPSPAQLNIIFNQILANIYIRLVE